MELQVYEPNIREIGWSNRIGAWVTVRRGTAAAVNKLRARIAAEHPRAVMRVVKASTWRAHYAVYAGDKPVATTSSSSDRYHEIMAAAVAAAPPAVDRFACGHVTGLDSAGLLMLSLQDERTTVYESAVWKVRDARFGVVVDTQTGTRTFWAEGKLTDEAAVLRIFTAQEAERARQERFIVPVSDRTIFRTVGFLDACRRDDRVGLVRIVDNLIADFTQLDKVSARPDLTGGMADVIAALQEARDRLK